MRWCQHPACILGKHIPELQFNSTNGPALSPRTTLQVHVKDAELLTDWQRRQAEFAQRRKISGAEGAKAKQERMRAFQERLRGAGAAVLAETPAAIAAPDADAAAEVRRLITVLIYRQGHSAAADGMLRGPWCACMEILMLHGWGHLQPCYIYCR